MVSRHFPVKPSKCRDCHFNPKPVQQPHPPIYFGGESDAALARVATLGNGWYGYDLDPAGVRDRMTMLEQKLGRRDANAPTSTCSSVRIVIALPPDLVKGIRMPASTR